MRIIPSTFRGNPLDFSHVGVPRTTYNEGVSLTRTSDVTLLNVRTGTSGIVRRISSISTLSPEHSANVLLNCFYDGNSTADWSVPLNSLLGWEQWQYIIDAQYTTSFYEIQGTPSAIGNAYGLYVTLYYPIPYQNGLKLTLSTPYNASKIDSFIINAAGSGYTAGDVVTVTQTNAANGQITINTVNGSGAVLTGTVSRGGSGYATATGLATTGGTGTGFTVNITSTADDAGFFTAVEYEDELCSGWNSNLRMMANRSNENVASGSNHLWLDTAATEKGWLVATYGGFADPQDDTAVMEPNVQMKLNGVTVMSNFTVFTAGTGYTVGDVVTVVQAGASGGTVMIDTVNGSGGVTGGHVVTGGTGYTDDAAATTTGGTGTNFKLYPKPQLQWSSTEDYFVNGYFFSKSWRGMEHGLSCTNATNPPVGAGGTYTAYKLFRENPIRYVAGMRGIWPNDMDHAVQVNWTTVRYKEV